MRPHVAHGYGLARSAGGSRGRAGLYFAGRHTTDKSAPDLMGGLQLTSGEGPGPGDGSTRTVVLRSLGLEQTQDSLRAASRPSGDKTPVGFAQRLW